MLVKFVSNFFTIKYLLGLFIILGLLFYIPTPAKTADLLNLSNTLSNPRPQANSNHTIQFTISSPIPASGKIIFTPKAGAFSIPADLSILDLDLTLNLTNQTLAATPGTGAGSNWGVTITPGSSGNIAFIQNDTDSVAVNTTVVIKIGNHTTFGGFGTNQILNPNLNGSYTYTLATQTSGGASIDSKTGAVSINPSVNITGLYDNRVSTPTISPNVETFSESVSVTLETSTPGSTIYYTLDGSDPTTTSLVYTTPILLTQTTTVKTFAVKVNLLDSSIASKTYTFRVPGGGGSIPQEFPPIIYTNASNQAYAGPKAVTIIHKCGNGVELILNLPNNYWPNNVLFTITCHSRKTIHPTNPITFTGDIPADTIFKIEARDTAETIHKFNLPGTFSIKYLTSHLYIFEISSLQGFQNTYQAPSWANNFNAQFLPASASWQGEFLYPGLYTTAGKTGVYDCNAHKADLNCDSRVNLTDLSILLYNWNGPKNNPRSDINKDRLVDLTDFSILLYYWTD